VSWAIFWYPEYQPTDAALLTPVKQMKTIIRQKFKSVILRFISMDQYLKWIDNHKGEFKPGGNQVNQDIFLRLLSKSKVKFVQIGANDGVKNDPVHGFIRKYRWSGVLVEPVPEIMEKLKKAYAGTHDLIFENLGIAGQSGTLDFYFLPAEYNEPDWLQQIGTFDKGAIHLNLANFPNLLGKIETRQIKTLTLKELMDKNKISKTDLLIIDAEGFEYKILVQLDQLREKPSFILFEWGCMNDTDQHHLYDFLKSQTYQLYSSGGDILAVLKR
jgi:FkbM family methyltransferase